jgi:ribosomal-protein-alanine N-acetyltransferase
MPARFESLTSADLEGLELTPMRQADAEEVTAWRYPGIYAFYDFKADPEDEAELLDSDHRDGTYFSARVPSVGLIGFAELKPTEDNALEIGLGLRPECAGRGLGTDFVRRICNWATDRVAPARLLLRVASFNHRAIRVYERVGFKPAGVETVNSYGTEVQFLRMQRGPSTTLSETTTT